MFPNLHLTTQLLIEESFPILLLGILRHLIHAKQRLLCEDQLEVSIREGRAVIPVSAANKRKIKGFVHDESATGKTVYIEPVEVVEINNELKELEYEDFVTKEKR